MGFDISLENLVLITRVALPGGMKFAVNLVLIAPVLLISYELLCYFSYIPRITHELWTFS